MKNKILGIFVCMLLIITAVPAVNPLNNHKSYRILPNKTQTAPRQNWTELQEIFASDDIPYNFFGESVSLDGNTALVGAYGNEGKGAAYVFVRNGTHWTQEAKLVASDGATGDRFGQSVSLDRDTALIGANGDETFKGSAYVFTRTDTTWTQQQKLFAPDGAAQYAFGISVSLSGDTALIGEPFDIDNGVESGSVYVFTRSGTTWAQQAKLLASDDAPDNYFGNAVSLSGDTALIGAYGDEDNQVQSGSAYIFNRTNTTWAQEAKLLASDGAKERFFGFSVSLDRDTALIGACQDNDNGHDSGSAYVFTCTSGIWTQQAKLLASDGAPEDYFGISVSLSGDTALIGAYLDDDNGTNSGSAYIFTCTGSTWAQQAKLLASDGAAEDIFGNSVSIDENTALIGVPLDDNDWDATGSACIFVKESGSPHFEINITGGLGVNAVITNNGYVNASGVAWQIHIEGGILGFINTTVNGTIDIPMGETKTVTTGLFLGLGRFTIIARANDVEKTGTGKILLFYVLGVI